MDIDSIEVVRAIKVCRDDLTKIAPFLAPIELTLDDLRMWQILISDKFGQELVRVGYLKDAKNLIGSECFNAYKSKVDAYLDRTVSQEGFLDWCKDKSQSQLEFVDGLERCRQREQGLSEIGYVPSARLQAGRTALKEYQESQRGVDPFAHAPLWEKFTETVIGLGWTVRDFLEISEALP